ncbi:MAG TPA: hypothetical protein VL332_00745 [Candidatus Saccharimonadaceae bacterium]|jgi:hypothetical protein|nr:hypothetical protein [Candidatus Saccharimonadaceae bacterium]
MPRLAALLTGVAIVLAAMAASARPAPAIRPALPGLTDLRRLPGDDVESGACATDVTSVTERIRRHESRTDCDPLPTPHSSDTNGIAVLEDDGTFFINLAFAKTGLDEVSVAKAFYRTHGDDYDALAVYLASGLPDWLGSTGALASADVIRNDVDGIGLDRYDVGGPFGSPSRLRTFLNMNALNRYPHDPDANIGGDTFTTLDVLAHEFAHRWLAYVQVDSAGQPSDALLGRDLQHWNFFADVDSSYMEGCDWARPAPDSFRTDGVSGAYGMLDQYLMGLRSKAETDSFFVVNAPTAFDPPGTYIPSTSPFVGLGCRGRATFWHVSDIEAVHGPRVPDAASAPHTFRIAMVLLVARGTDPTADDLAKLGVIRDRFPSTFAVATQGRGAVDPTLLSHAGRVRLAHRPLADTEDTSSPRTVVARAWIDPAGIPIALDPSSVKAWWRVAGSGAYAAVPLAPAAADTFSGSLPAQPSGTRVEYYVSAASDSAGIDATFPEDGAAAPLSYFTGPDTIPPVVVHVPVDHSAPEQLPRTVLAHVTDNVGVDSVWVESSVDGGARTRTPAAFAGEDSFAVAIGSGLAIGSRVAYRFVARDRSAAAHVTYSNPAFDTLTATSDWVEDFENGDAHWEHYLKSTGYRDPWHMAVDESFPGGGTAWKAGACDTGLYAPQQDAVLQMPIIYPVVPGTLLRFEHRYDLEEASPTIAFDGALVELLANGSPWDPVATASGYTHQAWSFPFVQGTPCWSGTSNGWQSEIIDLSPYAGQAIRVRFHMGADESVGGHGWWIDHVRVTRPMSGPVTSVPGGVAFVVGAPWPNPTSRALALSLSLPRAADVEWSLFDVAGRRLATLVRGRMDAGARTLSAPVPPALASGLYFTRVTVAGYGTRIARVAIVR